MECLLRLIVAGAVFVPLLSVACEKNVSCGEPTSWHEGNAIELTMSDEKRKNKSKWRMTLYAYNDIIIEKDEFHEGVRNRGKLGIIAGRMMITSGLDLKAGYEIDAADVPALFIQLLLRTLSEAVPDGPGSVTEPMRIHHDEPEEGIKVATAAASGEFAAPWNLIGNLEPDEGKASKFDLRFSSNGAEKDFVVHFTGTWKKIDDLGELNKEMILKDWKVYEIGPYSRKTKSGTIYDYGAQPISERFATIFELKNYIASKNKPNKALNTDP